MTSNVPSLGASHPRIRRRSALLASLGLVGGTLIRRAHAADPTRLVGVLEEDPPIINPAVSGTISNYVVGTPIYDAMTHIWPDGRITSLLAESWEIAPDGLAYTWHLRKGVTWHDGEPFTAADVKFSIENANGKLHGRKGAYAAIKQIEIVDDHTVVYHLTHPSPTLMYGTDTAVGAILPKHLWDNGTPILQNPHNLAPIGTGPFKMAEFVPGDHIRLVRHPGYYLPGKPGFDELVFRIIPDPSARVAAFEKGEVDFIYFNALPFSEAPRLAKLPGVTLQKTNLRGAAFIGIFNVRNKPYSDVRVRQAIAHAIDRGFIRDNVDKGFTIKMLGPVPPASPLYNADLQDYDFDPKRANDMLDAAGYPKGADGMRFKFNFLWPSTDAGTTRMADVIHENLKAIGIDVVLQPLERAALQQKGYVGLQFDMICETYGLGPDPDIGVEPLYNSNGLTPPTPNVNPSGYSNPAVDKLFDEQRVLIDLPKRKAVYDQIQKLIWDDVPVLPMFSYEGPNIYRSSVVTGVFQGSYGSQESFLDAAPVKAAAEAPATPPAGGNGWIETGGGVVVAAAAAALVLRRRRRNQAGDP